jgi:uncharacterized OsmC-like protein
MERHNGTSVETARDEVNAIIARFATPETSQLTTRVNATLREGYVVDVDMRKHQLVVDEPRGVGGTDLGPNPVELLLASLASCQAITYRVWAAKLGIALDHVEVALEGDIDLRGYFGVDDAVRPGYSALRLRVTLDGPETPMRYRRLADAVDGHCPVLDIAGVPVPVERVLVKPPSPPG